MLTRKEVQCEWTDKQEKALAEVKRLVTEAPVLRYYDPEKDLEIQCDASKSGLGQPSCRREKFQVSSFKFIYWQSEEFTINSFNLQIEKISSLGRLNDRDFINTNTRRT